MRHAVVGTSYHPVTAVHLASRSAVITTQKTSTQFWALPSKWAFHATLPKRLQPIAKGRTTLPFDVAHKTIGG